MLRLLILLVVAAFGWPVTPPSVVRPFDPPAQPWLTGHRGVDLAAPPATVVRSAGPGTVFFAGRVAGRGVVSVTHAGGLRTTYSPVTASVRPGEMVARGDPLGRLEPGHPGLHWGLLQGDLYLDPLTLLGVGRVRLLPV
jgi:murein DD-endopeptidase MepM/ murein hydrolase activator NlpD